MTHQLKTFQNTYLWLGIFVCAIYLPLFLSGSMVQDDFGFVEHAIARPNFFDLYHFLFSNLFANRPLAPLPIALSTILIGKHYQLYVILNGLIYLTAIFITVNVIKKSVGDTPALIFGILASIPVISMPTVVSPINLITASTALLYWSIALSLIASYCQLGGTWKYVLSIFLYISSLLTYEITFPLGVMLAFFPAIIYRNNDFTNLISYFFKFIAPIICALFIVLLWQKLIGPIFFIDQSRLNINFHKFPEHLYSWLDIFILHLPNLFSKSIRMTSLYDWFSSAIALTGLIYFFIFSPSEKLNTKNKLFFLFASVLTLLTASLILILSSSGSDIGGYQSRALSPTWIGLAFVMAALYSCLPRLWIRKILIVLLMAFICLSSNSFSISRDNYIDSWRIQRAIIDDFINKMQAEEVPRDAYILGNLPNYPINNFNNELIFSVEWDFGAAIRIASNNRILHASVMDARGGLFHNIRIINDKIYINDSDAFNTNNLWLYDYNYKTNASSLLPIKNITMMQEALDALGVPRFVGKVGKNSNTVINQKLDFSKKWYFDNEFFKSGWSINESWGRWSDGQKAKLILPMPPNEPRTIEFNLRAFVVPSHPSQRVLITLNNYPPQEFILKDFDNNLITIKLPKNIGDAPEMRVEFTLPDAVSPSKINSQDSDQRNLGIGIKSATFR